MNIASSIGASPSAHTSGVSNWSRACGAIRWLSRRLRNALSNDGIRRARSRLGQHVRLVEKLAERRINRADHVRVERIRIRRRRQQMHHHRRIGCRSQRRRSVATADDRHPPPASRSPHRASACACPSRSAGCRAARDPSPAPARHTPRTSATARARAAHPPTAPHTSSRCRDPSITSIHLRYR